MSADQLKQPADPEATLRAVLDVLAGTDLPAAATRGGIPADDLAAAVAVYNDAGRRALVVQTAPTWRHLYVEFADWETAEETAARRLLPHLEAFRQAGQISRWWFIRKYPCWRLRALTPGSGPMPAGITTALDQLASDGTLHGWHPGTYEPEAAAFGGDAGMAIAHDLFHADSRTILHRALTRRPPPLGRREASVLLCATLMRAAGLEWYEQADVWHRVAQERPQPDDVHPDKIDAMSGDLLKLLTADTSRPLHLDGAFTGPWVEAFRAAGDALGAAARDGTLDRGLREVIAYHVIFHWNRLGLAARTQSILAYAARSAILTPRTDRAGDTIR
jgi:thiopeptide-type bacteriocin biosynthesis protein